MYPDKKMDDIMNRLRRKIEAFVITVCIVIISICLVYMYIIRPSKNTSPKIAYEKFKSFSMPIGDVTGTEDYEETTVREYTDDWGIRHVDKKRIK